MPSEGLADGPVNTSGRSLLLSAMMFPDSHEEATLAPAAHVVGRGMRRHVSA